MPATWNGVLNKAEERHDAAAGLYDAVFVIQVIVQTAMNDVAVNAKVLCNCLNVDRNIGLGVTLRVVWRVRGKFVVVATINLLKDFKICWGALHIPIRV